MGNDTGEDRTRQILEDYRSGKLDKYEAMDALDVDHVSDLLALLRAIWSSSPAFG